MDEREPGYQPLDGDADGHTLMFLPTGRMYQPLSALAILAALHARRFTGVCECYIRTEGPDDEYMMGVGLAPAGEPLDEGWWRSFLGNVDAACEGDEDVQFDWGACGFCPVGEMREGMRHAGTVGFDGGSAVWVSDPAGPDPDSPFTVIARTARGESPS